MPSDNQIDSVRKLAAKNLTHAESLFKLNKFQECIRSLNLLEIRLRPFANQLSNELYDCFDKRCLVHRQLRNFPKARLDANSMMTLDSKKYKGYLCAAKLYEMEGVTNMALKMYRAGLANINRKDQMNQRFINAYTKFKSSIAADTSIQIPTDPIKRLPYPDIFHNILKLLSLQTIVKCTMVSKEWRKLILADTNLWCQGLDLTVKTYRWEGLAALESALKPVLQSSRPSILNSLAINRIRETSERPILNFIATKLHNRLRHLNIKFQATTMYRFIEESRLPIFPKLESLTLRSVFDFNLLNDILGCIPDLKELHVECTSEPPPVSFAPRFNFNTTLDPSNGDPSLLKSYPLQKLVLLNCIPDARFPKLLRSLKALRKLQIQLIEPRGPLSTVHLSLDDLSHLESFSVCNNHSNSPFAFGAQMKNISISNCAYPSYTVHPHPDTLHYNTQVLRLTRCVFSLPHNVDSLWHHLHCGPNLVHMFLEFTNLKPVFSEAGYSLYIAQQFPKLRTISLGGNIEVSDQTARAIANSPNTPSHVILSLTSVTDVGFDYLIRAGVVVLGLQNCQVTMRSLAEYRSKGVTLLEYARFA